MSALRIHGLVLQSSTSESEDVNGSTTPPFFRSIVQLLGSTTNGLVCGTMASTNRWAWARD